jgi:hypothetical protein
MILIFCGAAGVSMLSLRHTRQPHRKPLKKLTMLPTAFCPLPTDKPGGMTVAVRA